MKMHRCDKTGCRKLIPLDEKYCSKHGPQEEMKTKLKELKKEKLKSISKGYEYNSDRHKRYAHSYRSQELGHDFYQSSKWKRLARDVKQRRLYTCEVCGHIQLPNESMIVDHITPRRTAPELAYVESNLWLLDRACHNKKTSIEETISDTQLKQMTKEQWIKRLRD